MRPATSQSRFTFAIRALKHAWNWPFKRVVCLTALLCLIGEFYPLSHFPMYSGISANASYVYVQDANGSPLPMLTLFGVRTARAKKIYRSHLTSLTKARDTKPSLATAKEQQAAGEHLLKFLLGNMTSGQRALLCTDRLKLAYVHLSYEQRRFEKKEHIIATMDVPVPETGVAP